MILFHGSENIIKTPSYTFRNNANDFGSGFYCTEEIELAKEWACKKNADGFVNQYQFDTTNLSICNLISEEYHLLNWLALLTKYRGYWQKHTISEDAKNYLQENYLPDISNFDVIIGYRADDSYFSIAQDFVSGVISLRQLSNAMHLGKLGEQIVIKSERAFNQLTFCGFEGAEARQYYVKKAQRDLEARKKYAAEKSHRILDDIYMIDILRGQVNADDLRV